MAKSIFSYQDPRSTAAPTQTPPTATAASADEASTFKQLSQTQLSMTATCAFSPAGKNYGWADMSCQKIKYIHTIFSNLQMQLKLRK